MRIPFNGGAQQTEKQQPDSRQATWEREQQALVDQVRAMQNERQFRREEPKIPARNHVIARIQTLQKESDEFRELGQHVGYRIWQLQQRANQTTDIAALDALMTEKAELIVEQQAAETEYKRREREREYQNTLARDLLDGWDSLQHTRLRLLDALHTASSEERDEIEKRLAKVFERMKRFDDTEGDPRYCLAVPIMGGA